MVATKKGQKKESVIQRFIEDGVFSNVQEDLGKAYSYAVQKGGWAMHLRQENNVSFYYEGLPIMFKLYKDKKRFSYKDLS